MASIDHVHEIIHRISEGMEDEVLKCMTTNSELMVDMVREQMYSGLDGNGKYLSPDYLSDPYFNESGRWKGKARQYMQWKERITPPEQSIMLMLPARPKSVPNLFISGPFYRSLKASSIDGGVSITTQGFGAGDSIVHKYGENLLGLTETAREYFNRNKLIPWLEDFWNRCGWR